MTQDEIIKLAREAGWDMDDNLTDIFGFGARLERFANLVAEREACAKVAAQPEPPPEWEAINNIIAEYGLQAISFVACWQAAQRPWQGMTDEEIESAISDGFARGLDDGNVPNKTVINYVRGIEAVLKERNT